MSAVNKFITKEIWLFILLILMKGHSSADQSASVPPWYSFSFLPFYQSMQLREKKLKSFFSMDLYHIIGWGTFKVFNWNLKFMKMKVGDNVIPCPWVGSSHVDGFGKYRSLNSAPLPFKVPCVLSVILRRSFPLKDHEKYSAGDAGKFRESAAS